MMNDLNYRKKLDSWLMATAVIAVMSYGQCSMVVGIPAVLFAGIAMHNHKNNFMEESLKNLKIAKILFWVFWVMTVLYILLLIGVSVYAAVLETSNLL